MVAGGPQSTIPIVLKWIPDVMSLERKRGLKRVINSSWGLITQCVGLISNVKGIFWPVKPYNHCPHIRYLLYQTYVGTAFKFGSGRMAMEDGPIKEGSIIKRSQS